MESEPIARPIIEPVRDWTFDRFQTVLNQYEHQKQMNLGDLSGILRDKLRKQGYDVTPGYYKFGDFEAELRLNKLNEVFESIERLSDGDTLTRHYRDRREYVHIVDIYKDRDESEFGCPYLERRRTRGWDELTPAWVGVPISKMKGAFGVQHRQYDRKVDGIRYWRASFPEFPMTAMELVRRAQEIGGNEDRFSMYLLYKPEWEEFVLPNLDPIVLGKFYHKVYFKNEVGRVESESEHWFKICEWNVEEGSPL